MAIEHVDLAASSALARRAEDLHSLPELFVENTRLHPYQAPGLRRRARELASPAWRDVLRQTSKSYASSPQRPLPDTEAAPPPVARGSAPDLAALSHLLRLTAAGATSAPQPRARFREALASAADLGVLELYVLALEVEGLPPGLYHYNSRLSALESLDASLSGPGSQEALERLVPDPATCAGAAATVLVSAVPLRVCVAHGDRGYRLLLVEAGAAAERLRAGAAALGLASHAASTFYDERADRLLGLDGVEEFTVGLCLVGAGSGAPS